MVPVRTNPQARCHEAHRRGHAGTSAPLRIVGPLDRQVELPGQGQAVRVRHQQARRHPTVVRPFARSIGGPRLPIPGKPVSLDVPEAGLDSAARHDRQHLLGGSGPQEGVARWRHRHQVMHRLMGRPQFLGSHTRGHRLLAHASAGQHQPLQVPCCRRCPIRVPQAITIASPYRSKRVARRWRHRVLIFVTQGD